MERILFIGPLQVRRKTRYWVFSTATKRVGKRDSDTHGKRRGGIAQRRVLRLETHGLKGTGRIPYSKY